MSRILLTIISVCFLAVAGFGQGVPSSGEPNEELKVIMSGSQLYQEKKYDEAIATLKKGLELNPKNHGIHAMIGGIYLAQNKFDLGSEALGKAASIDPQKYIYVYFKARADALRGAKEEGIVAIKRAIELAPLEADAYYTMAELLGLGGGSVRNEPRPFGKR